MKPATRRLDRRFCRRSIRRALGFMGGWSSRARRLSCREQPGRRSRPRSRPCGLRIALASASQGTRALGERHAQSQLTIAACGDGRPRQAPEHLGSFLHDANFVCLCGAIYTRRGVFMTSCPPPSSPLHEFQALWVGTRMS
jgi:hypothetical protein